MTPKWERVHRSTLLDPLFVIGPPSLQTLVEFRSPFFSVSPAGSPGGQSLWFSSDYDILSFVPWHIVV